MRVLNDSLSCYESNYCSSQKMNGLLLSSTLGVLVLTFLDYASFQSQFNIDFNVIVKSSETSRRNFSLLKKNKLQLC